MSKTIKIVLLSILAAALILLMVWVIQGENWFFRDSLSIKEPIEETLEETLEEHSTSVAEGQSATEFSAAPEEIHKIVLSFLNEEIYVQSTADDSITITQQPCDKEELQMKCRVENGVLYAARPADFLNGFLDGGAVTLFIPENYVGELDIDTASGDISLTECTFSTIEIDHVNAEVLCNGIYADEIELNGTSGEVRLYDCTITESIENNTVSGNMEFVLLSAPQNIEIDSVSGEVVVTLPQNASVATKFESVSGQLINEFATIAHGDTEISVESVSGSLTIKRAA